MRFWIDDDEGSDPWETFDFEQDEGETIPQLHLAAMQKADAMGYSNHEGYFLITEDGQSYPVVDPYKDDYWLDIANTN